MLLIIMRHGKAVPKKPGMSDFERTLTDEGKEDVELVANLFPKKPDIVFSSPLKRAVETAGIVAEVAGGTPVKESWVLEPEQASLTSLRELEVTKYEVAVVIGHAPSVEEIASVLIGGGRIKMPAGSAVGIETCEIDLGAGTLKFFITPEIARKAFK